MTRTRLTWESDLHKIVQWVAGIGSVIISAAIIGTFSMLLTLRDSVIALQTTQGALTRSVTKLTDKIDAPNATLSGAISRAEFQQTLVSIDNRLRELEKGK